jgi:hypothetical protein
LLTIFEQQRGTLCEKATPEFIVWEKGARETKSDVSQRPHFCAITNFIEDYLRRRVVERRNFSKLCFAQLMEHSKFPKANLIISMAHYINIPLMRKDSSNLTEVGFYGHLRPCLFGEGAGGGAIKNHFNRRQTSAD